MGTAKVMQAQVAYGKAEELTNIISHGVGALSSLVGFVFIMLKATAVGVGPLGIAALIIYGLATVLTFIFGTLYHAMPYGGRAREVFRPLDHCIVPMLILGAYAPITLIGLMRGDGSDVVWGATLFAIVAATAILAVVLNGVDAAKLRIFSLIAYVVMGWACIMRADRIAVLCGWDCFWFLLGGGIVYAVGIVFYSIKKMGFNHAVSHIFVLAGAALHFVGIYTYLL